MLKLQEDEAKRRKLSEVSYSKLKEYHSDSSKEDETYYISRGKDQGMETIDQTKFDNLLLSLRETILKSREEYPMSKANSNYPADDDGNRTVRFVDIGQEATVIQFVPPGLHHDGINYEDCSYRSKNYGFVTFPNHQVARKFLDVFNGLEIPGTGLTYKLSWAPFMVDHQFNGIMYDYDVFEWKIVEEGGKIEESFDKFYSILHEKAHKEKKAFWSWPVLEEPEYYSTHEGPTTLILVSHVDPAIEEHQLQDLFDCFGKCTVKLYDNGFSGIVKFEDCRSANDAYEKLVDVLPNKGICYCTWAFEPEISPNQWYVLEEDENGGCRKVQYYPYCHVFGENCPHKDELLQRECENTLGQKFKLRDYLF